MIDDNLKEELIEQLDDLETQLDQYSMVHEVRSLLDQSSKSLFRWKCWLIASMFIIFCGLGAGVYGATLPGDHYLSMPFLACFLLTVIGIQIPRRETVACHKEIGALFQQERDEYYKLVTGQERRS